MVIDLEAPVFFFGQASLHLEQTFLVTAEGSTPLLAQERSTPHVPPELGRL